MMQGDPVLCDTNGCKGVLAVRSAGGALRITHRGLEVIVVNASYLTCTCPCCGSKQRIEAALDKLAHILLT